ncbi:MAG: hypothetical protein V4641_16365 [Pseudomonadota bacterium]
MEFADSKHGGRKVYANPVDAFFDIIATSLNRIDDKGLAKEMGLHSSSVAQYRKRRTVPLNWITIGHEFSGVPMSTLRMVSGVHANVRRASNAATSQAAETKKELLDNWSMADAIGLIEIHRAGVKFYEGKIVEYERAVNEHRRKLEVQLARYNTIAVRRRAPLIKK